MDFSQNKISCKNCSQTEKIKSEWVVRKVEYKDKEEEVFIPINP